jgi:hypothetical protein
MWWYIPPKQQLKYGAALGLFATMTGLYGLPAGIAALSCAVILYQGVLLLVFRAARTTWKQLARELEDHFDSGDPETPTELEYTGPTLEALPGSWPGESDLELSGTIEGRPVRIHVDGSGDSPRTVWEVDCTEFLPDWLNLRPARLRVTADWWVETGDVKVGHRELDRRFMVGGAEADRVRAFFWEHELGDDFAELFDDVGSFEVVDGVLRDSRQGIVRDGHTIQRQTVRLVTIATHLEQVVTAGYPETELPDEPVDEEWKGSLREEREDEVAHVYD